MKHILSASQFDRKSIEQLFNNANKFVTYNHIFNRNKILATLFYEPSTRTRLSFESAMLKLGGKVISAENVSNLSVVKGEDLEDTIRVVSGYCDVIVLRHNLDGAAETAAKVSSVPIINGGTGSDGHPTQALTDLYTIVKEKGRIDGLHVAVVGDLLYGRTVRSLLQLLSLYDVKISLVSHPDLSVPESLLKFNSVRKLTLDELDEEIDVVYLTRVQKERMPYVFKNYDYVFGKKELQKLKKDVIILHPLPRVTELSKEIDETPNAVYFKQARYGLWLRMALVADVLGI